MKILKSITAVLISLHASLALSEGDALCNGKFPNPITDYCWSCVFPIRIAGIEIPLDDRQEDTNDSVDATCTCGDGLNLAIGITSSFWEPSMLVDVVRKPFCMAGIGGVDMGNLIDAPASGISRVKGTQAKDSFYQVHWYVNPILYIIQLAVDSDCLDRSPFDMAYMTEIDPKWNDEELSLILNPDVFLYANPIAQAACIGDCFSATADFPLNDMYWCGGCQGSVFPFTGHVNNHIGLVDSSSLLLQKFTHMAHRELMIYAQSGEDGMCKKYPKFLIDKNDYKYSMVFPTPQRKIFGRCCQPFGRTTADWGSGTTFPYKGEDVVYQVFRKRDCCVSKRVSEIAAGAGVKHSCILLPY